jgi:hydrogenase nickel incorporation protein HypB
MALAAASRVIGMCKVCGCGDGDVRIESDAANGLSHSGYGHDHHHGHAHSHVRHHHGDGHIHFGLGPAGFDLGESAKIVILSVTEGGDKPLKYPDAFAAARLMILSKTDLLPYVELDVARCIGQAQAINPDIEILKVSARTGEGVQDWIDWLLHARDHVQNPHAKDPHVHA